LITTTDKEDTMGFLNKIRGEEKGSDFITIVSGLPRSGTSMMMRMLEAGGIMPVTDNIRKPDQDNPKGYYEFEKVKKIKEDSSWLPSCLGKCAKMVSQLLYELPGSFNYRIVFMQRTLEEVLASQKVMLERLGKNSGTGDDAQMAGLLERHLDEVSRWLMQQKNIKVLFINYNDIIRDPKEHVKKLNMFFDGKLQVDRVHAVVDSSLYRQRKSE
jgi:hypothetical protein